MPGILVATNKNVYRMKAAVRTQYGPPASLQILDLPKPIPRENDILVRVHASTVNRTDVAVLTGKPFIMRFFTGLVKPTLPSTGTDFAGVVEAVGTNVQTFKPGDRVCGFDDQGLGSHAQYLVVPHTKAIITLPDNITYEQAAASLEAAHYAINFLNKLPLQAGQTVMLNGGTGAIGSAMVQFLKNKGVAVTATCRTEHLELVRSLGAQKVIDYTREDFTQDERQYDFVLDAVGKSTFGKCKRLLKPGGIYISSELGPGAQNPFLALLTPLTGGKKVIFPLPTDIKASLAHIKSMWEQGAFSPLIDKRYPLEKIGEAFVYVASEQKVGNVVLSLE